MIKNILSRKLLSKALVTLTLFLIGVNATMANEKTVEVFFQESKSPAGLIFATGDKKNIEAEGVKFCQNFFPYYTRASVAGGPPMDKGGLFRKPTYAMFCGFKESEKKPTAIELKVLQSRKINKSPLEVYEAIKAWATTSGYQFSSTNPVSFVRTIGPVRGVSGGPSFVEGIAASPHTGKVILNPKYFANSAILVDFQISIPLPKPNSEGKFIYDTKLFSGLGSETYIKLNIHYRGAVSGAITIDDARIYRDMFAGISQSLFIEAIEIDPTELF
jgi:hypothetical protein